MKAIEKKLTRGLKDVSPLFSDVALREKHPLLIRKPEIAVSEEAGPSLICAALLPVEEALDISGEIRLLSLLGRNFQETFLFSVDPSPTRYEMLSRRLPIPPWEHLAGDDSIRFFPLSGSVSFGYISESKFQEAIQLKPALNPVEFRSHGKTLALFEPSSVGFSGASLGLMDHVVLILTPSSEHVLKAYELLRFCYARNQSIRFSILITGSHACETAELVYERFSQIVSQFVGCDVGLLGWVGNEIRLNSELLLEEAGTRTQAASKIRFHEMLRLHPC